MNDIAGPNAGLDMLMLVAGANPSGASVCWVDSPFSSFEAALDRELASRGQPGDEVTGEFATLENDPLLQRSRQNDRDRNAIGMISLPWGELPSATSAATPNSTIEQRGTLSVLTAAIQEESVPLNGQLEDAEFRKQPHLDNLESALPSPVVPGRFQVDTDRTQPAIDKMKSAADTVITSFDSVSEARIVASIAEATRQAADHSIEDKQMLEFEAAREIVPTPQPVVAQLQNVILESVRSFVATRGKRPVETVRSAESGENKSAHSRSAINDGRSAAAILEHVAATESQSPEGHSSAPESLEVSQFAEPVPMDELGVETGSVGNKHDEVVVEIRIPELGILEIEVSRDGDDTEVALIADPAVDHMLRDHLPALIDALSASGIELTGLDVRQHTRDEHAHDHRDWTLEAVSGNVVDMSPDAHISSRTGLSRYRQMSITA